MKKLFYSFFLLLIFISSINAQVNDWQQNDPHIYYENGIGNIGIGTSNPDSTLQIGSTSMETDQCKN